MVNMTNRPDVHMRLVALEFLLIHVPLTSRRMTANRSTSSVVNERLHFNIWSGGRDLNPQPSPWKSETLPLSYPRPVLLQISLALTPRQPTWLPTIKPPIPGAWDRD